MYSKLRKKKSHPTPTFYEVSEQFHVLKKTSVMQEQGCICSTFLKDFLTQVLDIWKLAFSPKTFFSE